MNSTGRRDCLQCVPRLWIPLLHQVKRYVFPEQNEGVYLQFSGKCMASACNEKCDHLRSDQHSVVRRIPQTKRLRQFGAAGRTGAQSAPVALSAFLATTGCGRALLHGCGRYPASACTSARELAGCGPSDVRRARGVWRAGTRSSGGADRAQVLAVLQAEVEVGQGVGVGPGLA